MSDDVRNALTALCMQWRARANRFMADAERARRGADMIRLTAMASTLDWAAFDLLFHLDAPRSARLLSETKREDESRQK